MEVYLSRSIASDSGLYTRFKTLRGRNLRERRGFGQEKVRAKVKRGRLLIHGIVTANDVSVL